LNQKHIELICFYLYLLYVYPYIILDGILSEDLKDIEGNDPTLPPLDGGRGWLVILGAFFIQVLCFGTASSCKSAGFENERPFG
jgi:hypothetical protein